MRTNATNSGVIERMIAHSENLYPDEFARTVYHRSNTYAIAVYPPLLFLSCAVIAWFVPTGYAAISFVPLVGFLIATAFGNRWLRTQTPTPKVSRDYYRKLPGGYVVLLLASTALWIGGMVYTGLVPNETPHHISMLSGAVVGGIAGLIISPFIVQWVTKRSHAKDEARFEQELGNE